MTGLILCLARGPSDDRVSTGIEGFDSLIEGGFPKGSLVLLRGSPGSGKTIFAARFLYHGLELEEPGIYVSFAENRETFLKNMRRLGMDFGRFEQDFRFMDLVTVKEKGVETILESVLAEMDSVKARRLVIDSFSALAQAFTEVIDVRIVLHAILGKMTRLREVTTLLVSEKPMTGETFGGGMEEFVVDGVVDLTLSPGVGYLDRRLLVVKMRGTKTSRVQVGYAISDRGMTVYPPREVKAVEKVFAERLSTGIEGLDRMFGGGVFRGSATMVAGASGTGKTTTALHFIVEGARCNERGLLISFEEPVVELIKHADGFGWSMRKFVDDGVVRIASLYPERYNIEEHLLQISRLVEEHKPARFVVDSLSPMERIMSKEEYVEYLRSGLSSLKARGVTSMLTVTGESTTPVTGTGISTLVDNIISLRDVELESALKRSLVVFKARGTSHARDIREFEITSKGLTVKEKFAGVEQILGGAPRRSLSEEATKAWAEAFKGR